MSVVALHGACKDINLTQEYIAKYKDLKSGSANIDDTAITSTSLQISLTRLETKYYSAELTLVPIETVNENSYGKTGSAEACILIANDGKVDQLDSDYSLICSTMGSDSFPVSLLLNIKLSDSVSTSDESIDLQRQQLTLWALDNGFEFIEINHSNISEGWNDRDKDGLPRLIEALECNMWSSIKKPAVNVGSNLNTNVTKPASAHNSGDDSKMNTSDIIMATPSSDDKQIAIPAPAGGDLLNAVASTIVVEGLVEDAEKVTDKEHVFTDFESLLQEARKVRDSAKAGNISDDLRRAHAESIATKLTQMLMIGDSSDDDSDNN